ncbi:MAG TPA: ABC transporter substrate-binding protein [Gemmataceae bacterium]
MSETRWQTPRRPFRLLAMFLPIVMCVGLMFSGCRGPTGPAAGGPTKIKICYLGLTCEPPIFVAYENGFFQEEGLDVELVKTDWNTMRDGLADGRFHASYSFIMYLMKPMEMGLDLKLTGGIHTGCLRIQAATKTDIKTVADLKDKRVGVTHMGSPPFLFASRVLAAKGIDPKNEVEWVTMPSDAMAKNLDQGRIDALASAEPIGTMLMAGNKVRTVCDQAADAPYDDEYCCIVVVNGKFAREDPTTAAKVTRALLKGAKWVGVNPAAAAKLAVEKNYVAATIEINTQAIAMLKFEPGVAKARRDVRTAALEMKKAGFLKNDTDAEELAKKAWQDLDGVTDDWLKDLQVEKVAGGGRPPKLSPADFAALFERDLCCKGGVCLGCCGDSGEALLPMTGEWALVRPLRLDRGLNSEAGPVRVEANR